MSQQQHLLNTIWSDDPLIRNESGFDQRGISIYRRNLLANAKRALEVTFPTVFMLLNSDDSEHLVDQFLMTCPPTEGDWSQWGQKFPRYLSKHELADDYPYLPDSAKLDWHTHCALNGVDQVLDESTLMLLGEKEPENILVEFNQNVTLIETLYPIAEIFDAHHDPDALVREAAMKKAQSILLGKPEKKVFMVFRPEFQPKIVKLSNSESHFMVNLKSGESLGEALNAVNKATNFSFEQWLIIALKRNLINYFKEK